MFFFALRLTRYGPARYTFYAAYRGVIGNNTVTDTAIDVFYKKGSLPVVTHFINELQILFIQKFKKKIHFQALSNDSAPR